MNRRVLLKILEGVLFVLMGICLYYIAPIIAQDLSTTDPLLGRFVPLLIMMSQPVALFFSVHNLVHAKSYRGMKGNLLGNGIAYVATSVAALAIDVISLCSGTYTASMGYPTKIYPFDSIVCSALFLLLGILFVLYSHKLADEGEEAYEKDDRGIAKKIVFALLSTLGVLVAAFYAGDLSFFFLTLDYTFDNFASMISVYLMMALPIGMLAVYEYVYRDSEEDTKAVKEFFFSTMFVLLALFAVIYFVIAEIANPNFIVMSGTALFPFDFMGSIPAGPYTLILLNLIPPVGAFASYLFGNRRPKAKS